MLMPDELKRDDFTRAIRGYSTSEVDDYVDFLIEKYTELDRKNDELERKLAVATNHLNDYKARENQLREMKKEAQRISASMIAGAEAKSGRMMNEAEVYCKSVMTDLDEKIAEKRAIIDKLTSLAEGFKEKLFEMYSEHISMLESASAVSDRVFDSVVEISRDYLKSNGSERVVDEDQAGESPKINFSTDSESSFVPEFAPDAALYDESRKDFESEIDESVKTASDLDSLDFVTGMINQKQRERDLNQVREPRRRPGNRMTLTNEFELVYSNRRYRESNEPSGENQQ